MIDGWSPAQCASALCDTFFVSNKIGDKCVDRFLPDECIYVSNKINLSNPKPGHAKRGSGRGARRGGGTGPGRTEGQQNSTPRRQGSLVPPQASRKRCLNVFPEARSSEILCKPNAGTKSAVEDLFIRG